MKKVIFTIFLSVSLSHAFAQCIYESISVPDRLEPEIAEAVSDMASLLEKATGKKIAVNKGRTAKENTILLLPAAESGMSKDILQQINADGQSFYLDAGKNCSVTIVGTGGNSFLNGIYTFLNELGFRWYMPGDSWTIIPSLKEKLSLISKIYTPSFRNRYYFGSGSARPIPGIDPSNTFLKDFNLWGKRNRLSYDYGTKGHLGTQFYSDMKTELDQHPEYFCGGVINKYGQINIDQQGAVDLFVKWALRQINQKDKFPVIGVEPADGSGGKLDCLPAGIPGIKTWSDKYFWLANRVAQSLGRDNSNVLVQLYAYSTHAEPPAFDLAPNVYTTIIPYAFQRVAEPQEYIRMWYQKMKGRPMGIYDYWNITQWSICMPQFNLYQVPEKLRFWKENNIVSINLESTYAKGPMGHAFWIATQLMWNTGLSFDKLYQEFLGACFGPGAADVKRMYDRWSLNYQGDMEAYFSARDLSLAEKKITNPDQLRRINELKSYVVYMSMYSDYNANPTIDNYNKLIDYVLSIHSLRLLHTSALQNLYIPKPKGFNASVNKNAIEKRNAVAAAPAGSVSSGLLFKGVLNRFSDLYSLSSLKFDISSTRTVQGKANKYQPLYINDVNEYHFMVKTGREIQFQAGSGKESQLQVRETGGKVLLDKTIKASAQGYENFTLNVPAGEYVISLGAKGTFARAIFPADIVFVSPDKNYDNFKYPLLYVLVPADVNEIVYMDQYGPGGNRGNWIDPSGKKATAVKLAGNIYKVKVPAQYKGKVWVLDIGHRAFKLLNLPEYYSLNTFTYDGY